MTNNRPLHAIIKQRIHSRNQLGHAISLCKFNIIY